MIYGFGSGYLGEEGAAWYLIHKPKQRQIKKRIEILGSARFAIQILQVHGAIFRPRIVHPHGAHHVIYIWGPCAQNVTLKLLYIFSRLITPFFLT